MNKEILQDILVKVYRRYPELAGMKPKVRRQKAAPNKPTAKSSTYTLTFKKMVHANTTAGAKSIPQITRITVNDRGAILKVSSSR